MLHSHVQPIKNQVHSQVPHQRGLPNTCAWLSDVPLRLHQQPLCRPTRLTNFSMSQNAAAKLVTRRTKYYSQTQCFINHHWLPIWGRIIHKILTLVYNMLDHKSLAYLQDIIMRYQPPTAGLRSEKKLQMPGSSKDWMENICRNTLLRSRPQTVEQPPGVSWEIRRYRHIQT